MNMEKIPDDATIASVIDSIDNPEGYLRGVIGNMVHVRNEHGSAVVRIGVTGRGIYPHYRVSPGDKSEALLYELMELVAYRGSNHENLKWDLTQLRGPHWSTREMTWDEVRELLARIRSPIR